MRLTERSLLGRSFCALAMALAGLALAAWAFHWLFPESRLKRQTGMPAAKLRELKEIAGEIDVLAIGTSRMLHGFDPAIFAAETLGPERQLRAYNLSLQRLLLWEQALILTEALRLPEFRPRLILLEPAVGLGIAPENFTHARTLEFETLSSWKSAVRVISGTDRLWWHKSWNIASHTLVLGLNLANYGAGTAWAFPPVENDTPSILADGKRGFIPLRSALNSPAQETQTAWRCQQYRDDYAQSPVDGNPLPEAMRTHFLALRDRLESTGTRVIFVQPPQIGFTSDELRQLTRRFEPSLRGEAPVLSFLDPSRHPSLFSPHLWSDYNHLNAAGAAAFTRELALALRPYLPEPAR